MALCNSIQIKLGIYLHWLSDTSQSGNSVLSEAELYNMKIDMIFEQCTMPENINVLIKRDSFVLTSNIQKKFVAIEKHCLQIPEFDHHFSVVVTALLAAY